MSDPKGQKWLHRYATFVAFATFLLIVAGALVTSNDAGLSVPDWPTSFGTFRMPRMVGGVKYEHGHRMIAGAVVILTTILALWLWQSERRRWVRRLGALAVLAIVAQAVLGGITVLLYLPVLVSVGHATLAQAFFCLTVCLALFTRADWNWDGPKLEETGHPSLRSLTVAATGLIFLQLILGAVFRHHGFGIIPHVVTAVAVAGAVLWLAARAVGAQASAWPAEVKRSVFVLTGLVLGQIVLGVGALLALIANKDAPQPMPPVVYLSTAHVAIGALVLASSLGATLESFRFFARPNAAVGRAIREAERATT